MISVKEFSINGFEICCGISGENSPLEVASLISDLNALTISGKLLDSKNSGNMDRGFVAFKSIGGKCADEDLLAEGGLVPFAKPWFALLSVSFVSHRSYVSCSSIAVLLSL